jgi:hypothetical protein
MKILFITTVALFISTSLLAQEQKVIAKFVISDARVNKQDVTKHYIDNGAYFIFYKLGDAPSTYFSSVMAKSDSQSYGRVYYTKGGEIPETTTDYKKEVISFRWSFQNTYDKEHGNATVKLIKTYKPAGVAFEMTILTEKLDLLVYKGYLEGSLNGIEE